MRRRRAAELSDDAIGAILLAALAVFVLAPLVCVVLWAFAEAWRPPAPLPTAWGFKYWGLLMARADVAAAIPTSLLISTLVTLLSAAVCLPAAYAFARLDFPGRRWLLLSFIAVNAFPRFPLYVAMAVLFLSAGLIGTVTAVVLVQLVFTLLYMIWIPAAAFRGVDPRMEEAGRDVGASHLTVLTRITLPQAAPALGTALLLTFVNTFYEVEGALLVGVPDVRTLPVVMLSLITGQIIIQYGAVLSVMLWVPSLVLLVFARRLFESRTFAAGFVGGSR
ncbi:ABC transporter permease [Labrys wisconsinensis]|uniref:Spermidine/putrescine transport system permease protein n=1 Tax=Labrys wisconsinensis TaxID=425677 RepID=A0ABU0JCX1_9HYPH|nr:ABC transporter permease subunit [Labrys wisconsinensis]MDQ0472137.1 putative spermidine/putrescine transport system permease protein [Labrys wisconsinensis]